MSRLMLAVFMLLVAASSRAQTPLRVLDYTPLVMAGAFDIGTTVYSHGREQNRAVNWITHEPTMLSAGAALEVGAFALAHRALGKKRPRVVRAAILTATALHVFAAVHNLQNPRRLR